MRSENLSDSFYNVIIFINDFELLASISVPLIVN